MDRAEFVEKINMAIEEGEQIKAGFKVLPPLSSRYNNYNDGMAVFYPTPNTLDNSDEAKTLISQLVIWQKTLKSLVGLYFGKNHPELVGELRISEPNTWYNTKRFAINDTQETIDVLKSYLNRLEYIDMSEHSDSLAENNHPYKVFISHSERDKVFVGELVNLLEYLGIKGEKLFCSSLEGYQIPVGSDIAEYILSQFQEYKLFVIIVHSPNYYNSPCSLNEMGAAWVLKNKSVSILTKDFEYSQMTGFISNNKIAIKVNSDDAKGRFNELKNILIGLFELTDVDENRWEKIRDKFLSSVS